MDIKEEKTKEKSKEELIYYLHDKWDQYDIIKSLFDNTEILEIEQNMKLKEEKKIFINNIIEKENRFNNDLKKYFIRTENKYFKNNKNIFDCNKGMELAIIKYHYYTMVLNVTTDAEQFKYILNNFGYFIIVIIIASTTVTIFNPKNANQKPGEDQWPNEIEYKDLQELVKIILFNTISFFIKLKLSKADLIFCSSIFVLYVSNFVSIKAFNHEIIELIVFIISFNFFDSVFLNSFVFSDRKS